MRRKPAVDTPTAGDRADELTVVQKEKQALQSELHELRDELAHLRSREETRLTELQQRIGDLESERETARMQVATLETSLQDATDWHASTTNRVETLEGQLEKGQREQRAALQEAAERQAGIDSRVDTLDARVEKENREQRAALQEAAERQAGTAQQVETLEGRLHKEQREHQAALQDALIREQRQNRRLNLVLGVAGMALLLGALAGAVELWDARNQAGMLAELRRDIHDIKASMEQQLGSMRQLLEEYRLSPLDEQTVGQAADSQSTYAGIPEEQPDRRQAESAAAVPTFGFHPHNKYRTRSEMRAFFAENARDLGVVNLDSGLQYKVLSHGNGRSPGPTDRVVYDYRAFLADGTEISNSYQEAEPQASRIDELKPGLQEALLQMNEGAQWELYIPPGLAYNNVRRRGIGDRAFEPLIYVVELKSVIEGGETGNEN
jgi:FKBP-type peptidyl-prolyl cis-trans isomerase